MKSNKFSEKSILAHLAMRLQVSLQDLVQYTGMPTSTVVGILSRLGRKGLVAKGGTLPMGRGRPTVMYHLRLPAPVFVCQFDGTQLLGAVLDKDFSFKAIEQVGLEQVETLDHAMEIVKGVVTRLEEKTGLARQDVSGLALSINAVKVGSRFIMSSVLPWANESAQERLVSALKIPVRLINLPSVLAEYQKFTVQAPKLLVLFNVGDGISAHTVLEGRLFRGHSNLAGELGHVTVDPNGPLCGCGRRGCLEAYCSGPAIYRSMLEELSSGVTCSLSSQNFGNWLPRQAMEELGKAWMAGDGYARAFMEPIFDRLGWGLGLMMNLMDPEHVAMSGYVLQGRQEWVDEIIRRSQRWTVHAATRMARFTLSQTTSEDELRVIGSQFFYEASIRRERKEFEPVLCD